MASKRVLRLVAALMIVAAGLAGLASRLAFSRPNDESASFFAGVGSMALRPAERIGGFVVEQVDAGGALRLRVDGCNGAIYAFPMLLTSVTIAEIADAAYLGPGYRSVDVYRGAVRARFSHLVRLLAHAALGTAKASHSYFVRFYTPASCGIGDDAYAAAAQALSKLSAAPETSRGALSPPLSPAPVSR